MAYREHGMWEVLDVLRRIHRGESLRSVARVTGRSRNTVRHYLKIAEELGWVADTHEPNELLAADVASRLVPGPQSPSHRESERRLMPHLAELKAWLSPEDPNKRSLKLTKVHQFLTRQGVEVHYSSLHRFAVKHLNFGRANKTTVRMAAVSPGELAEVDFGRLGLLYDPEKERNRVVHALVVTLVHSRHQYVHLTHSQKLADLICGLEDAWEFFGGVTRRVVIDNLKAAVTKADRYDPTFSRTFDEYAQFRDFIIDAAVAAHPTGKPHVERQVPYVRNNFFAGENFLHLADAQAHARKWCLTTAGLRTHGTTRKQPYLEFEKHEQPALTSLAKERFDTPQWGTPTVHPDFHIRFRQALYSVPYEYRGKKTDVRGDTKLVRIYIDGKLVKTHPRKEEGQRSTDHDDYPKEKSAYAMRDASYQIAAARRHGTYVGRFAEHLLSGDFPWSKLRQSQKLLRLCEKYGDKRLDNACKRAIAFELINVKRLERILLIGLHAETDQRDAQHTKEGARVIQLPLSLRFLREDKSFNHNTQTDEENADGH